MDHWTIVAVSVASCLKPDHPWTMWTMWTIVRFTLSRTRTHGHKPIYGPDGPDGPDLQVAGLVCKLCQVFDTVVTVAISSD